MSSAVVGGGLALVAALVVGTGSARQQVAAHDEDEHAVMDPRLILRLLRNKRWLIGMGVTMAGFGFQATSIATGRLVIVEPIFAVNIVVAMVVSARNRGTSLGRGERFGAAAVLVGIAGFLIAAAPTAGDPGARPSVPWPVVMAGLAAALVTLVVVARRLVPPMRGLALAIGAGLGFGFADALLKVITGGGHSIFGHWSLWTWMVVSPIAFLLQQSAYHSSDLAASLPGTSCLAPTCGVVLGAVMFDEHLRGGWAIPLEVVFALFAVVGVITLARSVEAAAVQVGSISTP